MGIVQFQGTFRYSRIERIYRVGRWVWTRGSSLTETGGIARVDGAYGAMLSLAFVPRPFAWSREADSWWLTILGVRLHYKRSDGGIPYGAR